MSDQRTQHSTVQAPVDLDEAQQLCDEATPGPWAWRGHDDGSIELRALHSGGLRIISTARSDPCVATTHDGEWVLLEHACQNCIAAYHDPDILTSGSGRRCSKPENLGTVWAWCDKGFIKPLNEWAVREVPYRADVADVTHPDARFVARSRELLPRLVAEVSGARVAIQLAEATVALRLAQEVDPLDYRDAYRAWRDALSAYLKAKGLGTGEFCEEHFSWLCATGQGQCQRAAKAGGA